MLCKLGIVAYFAIKLGELTPLHGAVWALISA